MTVEFDKDRYEHIDQVVEEISEIKEFGEELGLVFNGAFSSVDLQEKEVFYVYASRKFRIESGIGLGRAGRPWKILPTQTEVDEFIHTHEENEFDWFVYPTTIHARKKLPISKELLEVHSPTRRSLCILHEGFHFYRSHRQLEMPYRLEEALCTYVGWKGTVEFFARKKSLLATIAKENDLEQLLRESNFVNKYLKSLTDNYERELGKRDEILEQAREENPFENIPSEQINNAFFLLIRDYCEFFPLVYSKMKDVSLKSYLDNPQSITNELILHMDGKFPK